MRTALIVRTILLLMGVVLTSCQTFIETFDDVEACRLYTNTRIAEGPRQDSLRIATWNYRFAAQMLPWFGDGCGSRTLMTRSESQDGMRVVVDALTAVNADIVLLQEVDVGSKRSSYTEQMQTIMDHSVYRYGAYASNWDVNYIPSDGLGRVDEGNAVLSKYPIVSATRYQLPLRTDLDDLTRLFYVRECLMVVVITVPWLDKPLAVLNTHLSAFATDDTKKRQLDLVHDYAIQYRDDGYHVVIGGDFNLLVPTADSLDFCDADKCPGESFHQPGDDPQHKDGSNYAPEITWMEPLYRDFFPAITTLEHATDPARWFSHGVDPSKPYDRYIDHLLASSPFQPGSAVVYNALPWRAYSDHAIVVATWR